MAHGRLVPPLALVVLSIGCLERCAPGAVGAGVARLSVRSAAVAASVVDKDTACGFASSTAVVTVEGDVGGAGTVTTRVVDCAIAVDVSSEDCTGEITTASGNIVVSATKIIEGHLTGDANNPVIPAGPDAVKIVLDEVSADQFVVDASEARFMINGAFGASVSPRLFADSDSGFCTIPSRNAVVSGLVYQPSTVRIETPERQLDVDVATSSIAAFAGVTEQGENVLRGDITVYGSAQTIDDVLDPDYDAADFESRWTCAADLAQPLSGKCGAAEVLGGGSARLVLRSFGVIAKLVEQDTTCGFANADVKSRVTVTGEVGRDDAVATFGIAQPCPISIPDELLLSTDCSGVQTRVQGVVEVTGTKTVTGYNTGNIDTPVVPTSRDAVRFDLVAQIDGFEVSVTDQPTLVVDDGLLTGRVGVRTAQDAETGACSRATPAVTFEQVAFGGVMSIVSDDVTVAVEAELSDVSAQNGLGPASENTLVGEVEIDDVDVALDGELNPDYDAVDFQSGFICEENLLIPLDDDKCTFRGPLGQLTARHVMALIDAALTCTGECTYADEVVASDCTTETRASGGVTVSAVRTGDTFAIESMALESFVASGSVLTFSGDIAGDVEVVVDSGVETPGRRYSGISVRGEGTVELEGLTFHFTVDASDLTGERGGANELTGSITIDGQLIEIPVDRRDRTLDPEFDQTAFEARYACR